MGDEEAVGVSVCDEVAVGEALSDAELVVLGVPEKLPVCDALAPRVNDDVGVAVEDELLESVLEGDGVGVIVIDAVDVTDGVSDGEVDGVPVAEIVGIDETEVDEDAVGVLLAVPPIDNVWDGVAEFVGVPVDDEEALSLPVLDAEVVVDPVDVPVRVGVAVCEEVGVAVLVLVEEKETEGVCVEEKDCVDVPLADAN